MIEFEELPIDLQEQLEEIAFTDEFGTLEASTLYNGIRNSTGTMRNLAVLYEVPIELVTNIKDLNKLESRKLYILDIYENNQEIVMKIINIITDNTTPELYIDGTINDIKEEYINSIFIQLQNNYTKKTT